MVLLEVFLKVLKVLLKVRFLDTTQTARRDQVTVLKVVQETVRGQDFCFRKGIVPLHDLPRYVLVDLPMSHNSRTGLHRVRRKTALV